MHFGDSYLDVREDNVQKQIFHIESNAPIHINTHKHIKISIRGAQSADLSFRTQLAKEAF